MKTRSATSDTRTLILHVLNAGGRWQTSAIAQRVFETWGPDATSRARHVLTMLERDGYARRVKNGSWNLVWQITPQGSAHLRDRGRQGAALDA